MVPTFSILIIFGTNWTTVTVGTVEIRSIIVKDNTVLVGTDLLGAFRSTDSATSFSAVNSGLDTKWIQCFATDGVKIYAGSGNAGVYVSTDDGQSWQSAGLSTLEIRGMVAAPQGVADH